MPDTLPLPRALLPRTFQELGNDRIDSSPFVARRQAHDRGFLARLGGNRHALGLIEEREKHAFHANETARGERKWRGGGRVGGLPRW